MDVALAARDGQANDRPESSHAAGENSSTLDLHDSSLFGTASLQGLPIPWDLWDLVVYMGFADLHDERFVESNNQTDRRVAHAFTRESGKISFNDPVLHEARETCNFPNWNRHKALPKDILVHRKRSHGVENKDSNPTSGEGEVSDSHGGVVSSAESDSSSDRKSVV